MILRDDGYSEINQKDAVPGDVLIYRNDQQEISHIAIVVCNRPDIANSVWKTRVLSQWGADGEYFHDPTDVNAMLGKPDKFYSERRNG